MDGLPITDYLLELLVVLDTWCDRPTDLELVKQLAYEVEYGLHVRVGQVGERAEARADLENGRAVRKTPDLSIETGNDLI